MDPQAGEAAAAAFARLAQLYWRSSTESNGASSEPLTAYAAVDAIEGLMRVPGVGSWVVLALAASADEEFQRAYLAAGPFEDLLERADDEDLRRLDDRLPNDWRLVDCLYRMNEPDSPVGRTWLDTRLAQYPRPQRPASNRNGA